jgi:hypothetical protein
MLRGKATLTSPLFTRNVNENLCCANVMWCGVDREMSIQCAGVAILNVGAYAAVTSNGTSFHSVAAMGAAVDSPAMSVGAATTCVAVTSVPQHVVCEPSNPPAEVSDNGLLSMAPVVEQAILACAPGSVETLTFLGMTANVEGADGCLFRGSTNVTLDGRDGYVGDVGCGDDACTLWVGGGGGVVGVWPQVSRAEQSWRIRAGLCRGVSVSWTRAMFLRT